MDEQMSRCEHGQAGVNMDEQMSRCEIVLQYDDVFRSKMDGLVSARQSGTYAL